MLPAAPLAAVGGTPSLERLEIIGVLSLCQEHGDAGFQVGPMEERGRGSGEVVEHNEVHAVKITGGEPFAGAGEKYTGGDGFQPLSDLKKMR